MRVEGLRWKTRLSSLPRARIDKSTGTRVPYPLPGSPHSQLKLDASERERHNVVEGEGGGEKSAAAHSTRKMI